MWIIFSIVTSPGFSAFQCRHNNCFRCNGSTAQFVIIPQILIFRNSGFKQSASILNNLQRSIQSLFAAANTYLLPQNITNSLNGGLIIRST